MCTNFDIYIFIWLRNGLNKQSMDNMQLHYAIYIIKRTYK